MKDFRLKDITATAVCLIFIAFCGCGKSAKVSTAHNAQLTQQQIQNLQLDKQSGGDLTVDAINFIHQLYLAHQLPGPKNANVTSVLPAHSEQSTNYPVIRHVRLNFKTNDCRITYMLGKESAAASWTLMEAMRYDDQDRAAEWYAVHVSSAEAEKISAWNQQETKHRQALNKVRMQPGGDLTVEAGLFIQSQIKAGLVPGIETMKSLVHKPNDQSTNYPATRLFSVILADQGFHTELTVVKKSPDSSWALQDARRINTQGNTVTVYPIKN